MLTGCSTTLQQVVDNIDQVVHFCACMTLHMRQKIFVAMWRKTGLSNVLLPTQFDVKKFFVILHGEYNTSLALWKHYINLLLQNFCSVSSDFHQHN